MSIIKVKKYYTVSMRRSHTRERLLCKKEYNLPQFLPNHFGNEEPSRQLAFHCEIEITYEIEHPCIDLPASTKFLDAFPWRRKFTPAAVLKERDML